MGGQGARNYQNTSAPWPFQDLINEDQEEEIEDAFLRVDDWFDVIIGLNTPLVEKYDAYAESKGQPSYERIARAGAKLIEDADAALVKECESWKVEQK